MARFERTEVGGARPIAAEADRTAPARIELPSSADGAVELADRASGARVAFALEGAGAALLGVADGLALYADALGPGADLVHRVTADGTEDFVAFSARPALEELVYRVDVTRVAGLRSVEGTVEFVDARGAPRLRIAAPYVVDAGGRRRAAALSIGGCDHDRDPRAPWGRPPVAPGARTCAVRVAWAGLGVDYPALVDPAWSTTGSLLVGRTQHTASVLQNGQVLVAGGGTPPIAEAELYDPGTGTFAVTGSLATARSEFTASVLANGQVLAAAGYGGYQAPVGNIFLTSAELYDPALGTWAPTGSLGTPRSSHTASVLANGMVLVAGGSNLSPGAFWPANAELYDPGSGIWSSGGTLALGRSQHTQTTLSSGKVLVVGGNNPNATPSTLASVELYDPVLNTWGPAAALSVARYNHTASLLHDGRVLVAGGLSALTSVAIYDPVGGTWTTGGPLLAGRYGHTASVLTDGRVLVAGGEAPPVLSLATTEVYDPIAAASASAGSMANARTGHTASVLLDGRVLVATGTGSAGYLTSAELFARAVAGAPCATSGECASGFCVDGLCCDQACGGLCEACSAARKGSGADGVCAPVAAGTDPGAQCTDDGSPSCKQNGACDGNGACQTYSGPGCVPRPCATGADCTSGSCADGICCDQACQTPCTACTAAKKGGGVDGVCGPVAAGTDPNASCVASGGACGPDGLCDGLGACRKFAPTTTSCGPTSCLDATVTSLFCDGLGACSPGTTSCGPYLCADSATCASSCATDAACGTGFYCAAPSCAAKKPQGAACTASDECAAGPCVDGFCCDGACTGACEACDVAGLPGTCSAVTGAPHDKPACTGAGTECGSTCDGKQTATCTFVASATPCGTATCTAGAEHRSQCDGQGACAPLPDLPCSPHVCEVSSCNQTCQTAADCVTGFVCKAGQCVASGGAVCVGNEVQAPGGTATPCDPYRCVDGACTRPCKSASDCISPNACDGDGQCVAPPESQGATPSSGCSCELPGNARSHQGDAPIGVAVLLVFAGIRRRGSAGRCTRV